MMSRLLKTVFVAGVLASGLAAQPPRDGGRGSWIRPHDENRNGSLEASEITAAIERTFAGIDANRNNVIDEPELRLIPRPRGGGGMPHEGPGPGGRPRGGGDDNRERFLPPFLFGEKLRGGAGVSKERFVAIVTEAIRSIDKNGDGSLSGPEADAGEPMRKDDRQGPPPSAQFLGAEMRFGDKPVKGRPFSAETVVEDTRLLFDGTTVKTSRTGAIYRDGTGRIRREQTLDAIAGTRILTADDKPLKLIFITDFAGGSQIFLDENQKLARRTRLNPRDDIRPGDTKNDDEGVAAGTKTIDGVTCELTRSEREIPVGRIGNEKPLKIVSERCYSLELQVVIMSSHRDPLSGLHEFTLRNIKRSEPASDLFAVPGGYKVEN